MRRPDAAWLPNSAATKYGATQKVALPDGTTAVWKVHLAGHGHKLDVVALVTQRNDSKDTAYGHTQTPEP